VNYITFVDLFASICAIKKEDFIPPERRAGRLVVPLAQEGGGPTARRKRPSGEWGYLKFGFYKRGLFSADPENSVVKTDYL